MKVRKSVSTLTKDPRKRVLLPHQSIRDTVTSVKSYEKAFNPSPQTNIRDKSALRHKNQLVNRDGAYNKSVDHFKTR